VSCRSRAREHTAVFVECQSERLDTDIVCATGQIESNYDETVDSFDTMNLKPELLRGVSQIKDILHGVRINALFRCLCLRFRAPVSYPAACYYASH
jgi:hypothetical protein